MRTPIPNGGTGLVIGERRVRGFRPIADRLGTELPMDLDRSAVLPTPDRESAMMSDGAFKRDTADKHARAFVTREEWLEAAADELGHRVFSPAGHHAPQVRVSIGFPSKKATSRRNRSDGQCWSRGASEDRLNQIYLSPLLTSSEEIVDVLTHELVHAVDDCKSGHRGQFWTICKAIGLTKGTPASASADSDLKATIAEICQALGPLPHATLHALDADKTQSTRLLKVKCPACGYTCRITAKWIVRGLPICPCGSGMTASQMEIGPTLVGDSAVLQRSTQQAGG